MEELSDNIMCTVTPSVTILEEFPNLDENNFETDLNLKKKPLQLSQSEVEKLRVMPQWTCVTSPDITMCCILQDFHIVLVEYYASDKLATEILKTIELPESHHKQDSSRKICWSRTSDFLLVSNHLGEIICISVAESNSCPCILTPDIKLSRLVFMDIIDPIHISKGKLNVKEHHLLVVEDIGKLRIFQFTPSDSVQLTPILIKRNKNSTPAPFITVLEDYGIELCCFSDGLMLFVSTLAASSPSSSSWWPNLSFWKSDQSTQIQTIPSSQCVVSLQLLQIDDSCNYCLFHVTETKIDREIRIIDDVVTHDNDARVVESDGTDCVRIEDTSLTVSLVKSSIVEEKSNLKKPSNDAGIKYSPFIKAVWIGDCDVILLSLFGSNLVRLSGVRRGVYEDYSDDSDDDELTVRNRKRRRRETAVASSSSSTAITVTRMESKHKKIVDIQSFSNMLILLTDEGQIDICSLLPGCLSTNLLDPLPSTGKNSMIHIVAVNDLPVISLFASKNRMEFKLYLVDILKPNEYLISLVRSGWYEEAIEFSVRYFDEDRQELCKNDIKKHIWISLCTDLHVNMNVRQDVNIGQKNRLISRWIRLMDVDSVGNGIPVSGFGCISAEFDQLSLLMLDCLSNNGCITLDDVMVLFRCHEQFRFENIDVALSCMKDQSMVGIVENSLLLLRKIVSVSLIICQSDSCLNVIVSLIDVLELLILNYDPTHNDDTENIAGDTSLCLLNVLAKVQKSNPNLSPKEIEQSDPYVNLVSAFRNYQSSNEVFPSVSSSVMVFCFCLKCLCDLSSINILSFSESLLANGQIKAFIDGVLSSPAGDHVWHELHQSSSSFTELRLLESIQETTPPMSYQKILPSCPIYTPNVTRDDIFVYRGKISVPIAKSNADLHVWPLDLEEFSFLKVMTSVCTPVSSNLQSQVGCGCAVCFYEFRRHRLALWYLRRSVALDQIWKQSLNAYELLTLGMERLVADSRLRSDIVENILDGKDACLLLAQSLSVSHNSECSDCRKFMTDACETIILMECTRRMLGQYCSYLYGLIPDMIRASGVCDDSTKQFIQSSFINWCQSKPFTYWITFGIQSCSSHDIVERISCYVRPFVIRGGAHNVPFEAVVALHESAKIDPLMSGFSRLLSNGEDIRKQLKKYEFSFVETSVQRNSYWQCVIVFELLQQLRNAAINNLNELSVTLENCISIGESSITKISSSSVNCVILSVPLLTFFMTRVCSIMLFSGNRNMSIYIPDLWKCMETLPAAACETKETNSELFSDFPTIASNFENFSLENVRNVSQMNEETDWIYEMLTVVQILSKRGCLHFGLPKMVLSVMLSNKFNDPEVHVLTSDYLSFSITSTAKNILGRLYLMPAEVLLRPTAAGASSWLLLSLLDSQSNSCYVSFYELTDFISENGLVSSGSSFCLSASIRMASDVYDEVTDDNRHVIIRRNHESIFKRTQATSFFQTQFIQLSDDFGDLKQSFGRLFNEKATNLEDLLTVILTRTVLAVSEAQILSFASSSNFLLVKFGDETVSSTSFTINTNIDPSSSIFQCFSFLISLMEGSVVKFKPRWLVVVLSILDFVEDCLSEVVNDDTTTQGDMQPQVWYMCALCSIVQQYVGFRLTISDLSVPFYDGIDLNLLSIDDVATLSLKFNSTDLNLNNDLTLLCQKFRSISSILVISLSIHSNSTTFDSGVYQKLVRLANCPRQHEDRRLIVTSLMSSKCFSSLGDMSAIASCHELISAIVSDISQNASLSILDIQGSVQQKFYNLNIIMSMLRGANDGLYRSSNWIELSSTILGMILGNNELDDLIRYFLSLTLWKIAAESSDSNSSEILFSLAQFVDKGLFLLNCIILARNNPAALSQCQMLCYTVNVAISTIANNSERFQSLDALPANEKLNFLWTSANVALNALDLVVSLNCSCNFQNVAGIVEWVRSVLVQNIIGLHEQKNLSMDSILADLNMKRIVIWSCTGLGLICDDNSGEFMRKWNVIRQLMIKWLGVDDSFHLTSNFPYLKLIRCIFSCTNLILMQNSSVSNDNMVLLLIAISLLEFEKHASHCLRLSFEYSVESNHLVGVDHILKACQNTMARKSALLSTVEIVKLSNAWEAMINSCNENNASLSQQWFCEFVMALNQLHQNLADAIFSCCMDWTRNMKLEVDKVKSFLKQSLASLNKKVIYPDADEEIMFQIVSMGFNEHVARRATMRTFNKSMEDALQYAVDHASDEISMSEFDTKSREEKQHDLEEIVLRDSTAREIDCIFEAYAKRAELLSFWIIKSEGLVTLDDEDDDSFADCLSVPSEVTKGVAKACARRCLEAILRSCYSRWHDSHPMVQLVDLGLLDEDLLVSLANQASLSCFNSSYDCCAQSIKIFLDQMTEVIVDVTFVEMQKTFHPLRDFLLERINELMNSIKRVEIVCSAADEVMHDFDFSCSKIVECFRVMLSDIKRLLTMSADTIESCDNIRDCCSKSSKWCYYVGAAIAMLHLTNDSQTEQNDAKNAVVRQLDSDIVGSLASVSEKYLIFQEFRCELSNDCKRQFLFGVVVTEGSILAAYCPKLSKRSITELSVAESKNPSVCPFDLRHLISGDKHDYNERVIDKLSYCFVNLYLKIDDTEKSKTNSKFEYMMSLLAIISFSNELCLADNLSEDRKNNQDSKNDLSSFMATMRRLRQLSSDNVAVSFIKLLELPANFKSQRGYASSALERSMLHSFFSSWQQMFESSFATSDMFNSDSITSVLELDRCEIISYSFRATGKYSLSSSGRILPKLKGKPTVELVQLCSLVSFILNNTSEFSSIENFTLDPTSCYLVGLFESAVENFRRFGAESKEFWLYMSFAFSVWSSSSLLVNLTVFDSLKLHSCLSRYIDSVTSAVHQMSFNAATGDVGQCVVASQLCSAVAKIIFQVSEMVLRISDLYVNDRILETFDSVIREVGNMLTASRGLSLTFETNDSMIACLIDLLAYKYYLDVNYMDGKLTATVYMSADIASCFSLSNSATEFDVDAYRAEIVKKSFRMHLLKLKESADLQSCSDKLLLYLSCSFSQSSDSLVCNLHSSPVGLWILSEVCSVSTFQSISLNCLLLDGLLSIINQDQNHLTCNFCTVGLPILKMRRCFLRAMNYLASVGLKSVEIDTMCFSQCLCFGHCKNHVARDNNFLELVSGLQLRLNDIVVSIAHGSVQESLFTTQSLAYLLMSGLKFLNFISPPSSLKFLSGVETDESAIIQSPLDMKSFIASFVQADKVVGQNGCLLSSLSIFSASMLMQLQEIEITNMYSSIFSDLMSEFSVTKLIRALSVTMSCPSGRVRKELYSQILPLLDNSMSMLNECWWEEHSTAEEFAINIDFICLLLTRLHDNEEVDGGLFLVFRKLRNVLVPAISMAIFSLPWNHHENGRDYSTILDQFKSSLTSDVRWQLDDASSALICGQSVFQCTILGYVGKSKDLLFQAPFSYLTAKSLIQLYVEFGLIMEAAMLVCEVQQCPMALRTPANAQFMLNRYLITNS